MGLSRNVGTIGGLTAVSRTLGFARDMALARLLGAGAAADAFQLAFVLPNTFRRLFAEGAFSVAFVPLYSRALHGADDPEAGEAVAAQFAAEALAVLGWALAGISALAMLGMPVLVWLLASDFAQVPGKFALAVTLSRITFPYLFMVSLVALLSGLLNARSRFWPGAFAPVLLNLTMLGGIGAGTLLLRAGHGDIAVASAVAISVALSGVVQLVYMAWATARAGVRPRLVRPRLSPRVRRLLALIVPATFGAGIYQVSQFVDTFFATGLPQGSLTLLKYADRLNQMPLGIVGIALGTAILPMLARHIHAGENAAAQRLQVQAVEAALLLTLPAAAALSICAPAFTTALFVGGKMTAADGATMARIVAALVCGLPAYVLVKVFQPAFFSREDTRTPTIVAALALAVNIALNVAVVPRFGIVGLAGATAFTASLNAALLGVILARRGWLRFTGSLVAKVARQVAATAAMAALLWWLEPLLARFYTGGVPGRIGALAALIGAGAIAFATAALATGALDKRLVAQLGRRPQ